MYETAEARREFDRWSGHYDRTVFQALFFHPSHRMLLETFTPADRRVLDIGCGTGQFAAAVLERFPETQVWGMDLSDGMLRQCRQRCQAAGGRLNLVQGDSQRLPFEDDSFDVITCTHSFHHYPRQECVVAEMHRVLRPGGRLLIIDGDRDRFWGRFIFNFVVVLMEGAVKHLTSHAFREIYRQGGFDRISQRRRGGPLPFLMTVGHAVKEALPVASRAA
jgi:ubiquinone/menaquinone biosynthesis C-methylase UbiE